MSTGITVGVGTGDPREVCGDGDVGRDAGGAEGGRVRGEGPIADAGGSGGAGRGIRPVGLGDDDRGDERDDESDDRSTAIPDIPALHARVIAAIPAYWAARAAMEAAEIEYGPRDSDGDLAASLAITRAAQRSRRTAAELIDAIEGHADAMDGMGGGMGRGVGDGAGGDGGPAEEESSLDAWRMFAWGGRLYLVGSGADGTCGRDGVVVVGMPGWVARMVGEMSGGGA